MPIILAWLDREQPDVLCIQETKVQDKDFPESQILDAGYGVIYRGQKSYNGVAIISKFPMDGIRLNLYEGGDEDARFISARIKNTPLLNAYVPQGSAVGTEKFEYKLRWLNDLLSHIKDHYDSASSLLLMGDFNVALESIDVYDPEKFRGEVGFHPDEQAIMQKYFEWGFVDLFRSRQPAGGHFTFWDYRIPNALKRKMGWRIDYILSTPSLAEKLGKTWIDTDARTLQKPSDHTFLVAEFDG